MSHNMQKAAMMSVSHADVRACPFTLQIRLPCSHACGSLQIRLHCMPFVNPKSL